MGTSMQATSIPTFTIADYGNPDFPRALMRAGADYGECYVILKGNLKIKMPVRVAILNFLAWQPLLEYGLEPSRSEVFNFKSITTDSLSKVQSVIYERLLDAYPDIDDEFFNQPEPDHEAIPDMTINKEDFLPVGHMKFVYSLARNIEAIENFAKEMIPGYWPSIDGLSLARLTSSPDFKDLIEYQYDESHGTAVVEQQIKSNTVELLKRLNNPNLKDNLLYAYMSSGALKPNQVAQNIMIYGARSDIDDSMMSSIVRHSGFYGVTDTKEFAIEALSAKKATYLLKNVTKQSQYFGRKLKLTCATQQYLHRRSCGSTETFPYTIPEKYASSFVDMMVEDKNEPVILTKSNISNYVNREVKLITPFGCRHHDGFCERCAGYGKGRLISYLPLGIHIGIFAAIQLIKRVTQKVLSAKHLISTKSMMYQLIGTAMNYLLVNSDKIYWKPTVGKNIGEFSIKIPADALGPIIDLGFKGILPTPETFSKVSYWYLMRGDQVEDVVQMEQGGFFPFLSGYMLQFMHDNYDKLIVDDEGIIVPLAGFDTKQALFQYVIINDDMVSYVNRVASFLGTDIEQYTDLVTAYDDFNNLIFSKSPEMISFYNLVILRNFLITSDDNYTIPQVLDPHHVKFAKLSSVVSESTVSMKFAFEDLKAYLNTAETMIKARPAGLYAPFFAAF